MSRTSQPMSALCAVVAALSVLGCSSPRDVTTADVSITYGPTNPLIGMPTRRLTLTCGPDGGSHPTPASACKALLAWALAGEPVPNCNAGAAGFEYTITGNIATRTVNASFYACTDPNRLGVLQGLLPAV